MGSINAHPVDCIREMYNLNCFIETGTWKGTGIQGIINVPFKQILSVDISPKHLVENILKFRGDDRIKLFIGDSGIKLQEMLEEVDQNDNILFWLDAHLPDLGGEEKKLPEDVIAPLKRELLLIKKYRNVEKDVFIIDDLRLYEYVKYSNFQNIHPPDYKGNVNFIQRILGDTHNLMKDYRHQGYVMCFPKQYKE